MEDPDERNLVVKALSDGMRRRGAVEWKKSSADNVRNNKDMRDISPEFIRREWIRLVIAGEVPVIQKEEKSYHKSNYKFHYMSILPFTEFQHGLYVKCCLIDPDPEFPRVCIVSAHPETK